MRSHRPHLCPEGGQEVGGRQSQGYPRGPVRCFPVLAALAWHRPARRAVALAPPHASARADTESLLASPTPRIAG